MRMYRESRMHLSVWLDTSTCSQVFVQLACVDAVIRLYYKTGGISKINILPNAFQNPELRQELNLQPLLYWPLL